MFDQRTLYMNNAEAPEESLMSMTRGEADAWEDALTDCLHYWTDNDAQKALSELGLDTTKDGAVSRLFFHYVAPETRNEVVASWHEHGQYLPERKE